MKKYIRIISLMLAVLMVAALSSCSGCTLFGGKSLYDRGLDVIELMMEKASSEEYIDAFLASAEYGKDIIASVAELDYDEPTAVYSVKADEEELMEALMEDSDFVDGFSGELKDSVIKSALIALITRLNSIAGSDYIIASSVLTSEKVFVDSKFEENVIYIYNFEEAYPVAVVFTKGEDNAVKAVGNFIFYEDFSTDSADDIAEFFEEGDISVEVEEIKK